MMTEAGKNAINKKMISDRKIRGIFIFEFVLIMLIFIFMMILVNNGIVNLIHQEWRSAAQSAALGGAGKLNERKDHPNAKNEAIKEAITLATLHQWMEGYINEKQLNISVGRWDDCLFVEGRQPSNAVKVEITPPRSSAGNVTGLLAFFGTFDVAFFQKSFQKVSAVGVVYDETAVLVDYEGNVCPY